MADVRKELKVKSIRWKIEKRVLERLGHVMRMEDGRMTKAVVLGWMEDLENREVEKKARKDKENGELLEKTDEGGRLGLHRGRRTNEGQERMEEAGKGENEASISL